MFTPAITASSVSLPARSISMARAHARSPFSLEITIFFGAAVPVWPAAGKAAEANMRFRLVIIQIAILHLSLRENASGHPGIGAGAHFGGGGQEKEAAGPGSAGSV